MAVTRRSTSARPSDDQLLDAACSVFAATGFRGASMEAIAEAADSTKPTLYAHFGSKESLHRRLLEREARRFTRSLLATYERSVELSVREAVRVDMLAFFDYAATHPDGFRLLFDQSASVREELEREITERVGQTIRALMSRRRDPAPQASADALAAMVVGIAVHGARHALATGSDLGRAGELAASMAHAGLRGLDRALMDVLDA